MARVLLGVSGGIAAYRALELTRLLTRAGHGVRVIMTPNATRFVGAASFEAIAGSPVLIDEFEHDPMRGAFPGDPAPGHDPIGHLEVVANADVFLVAPATANTVAKLAAGLGDSMLTTAFLACQAPRAVAPAMNDRMYRDAATQANLATLRDRGIVVIEPEEGALASRGEHGVGRLPAPGEPRSRDRGAGAEARGRLGRDARPGDRRRNARADRLGALHRQPLERPDGPCPGPRRPRRGAEVTLIAANVALAEPAGVERIDVETTAELAAAVETAMPECDVLLMAAAVADFRAADPSAGKLSRAGSDGIELRLTATEDILAAVAVAAAARARRSSGSPPSTAPTRSPAPARSSSARASTRSSSTTSREATSASTRPRTRSRSSTRAASGRFRSRPRTRSPRRSWIAWRRAAGLRTLEAVPEKQLRDLPLRPLLQRDVPARGRGSSSRPRSHWRRPRGSRRRSPRSARRSGAPTSAPAATRRRRRSSPPWSSATRSTTTPTSASAAP